MPMVHTTGCIYALLHRKAAVTVCHETNVLWMALACHVLDVLHVHNAHIDASIGRDRLSQAVSRIGQRETALLEQQPPLRIHHCRLIGRQPGWKAPQTSLSK